MSKDDPKQVRKDVAKTVLTPPTASSPAILSQLEMSSEFSNGPLPPPEMLRRYNEAVPNGAERIMAMAEREQAHFHRMQARTFGLVILGQVGGLIFVLTSLASAFYLASHDKPLAACGGVLSALCILFGGGYLAGLKNTGKAKGADQAQKRKTPESKAKPELPQRDEESENASH